MGDTKDMRDYVDRKLKAQSQAILALHRVVGQLVRGEDGGKEFWEDVSALLLREKNTEKQVWEVRSEFCVLKKMVHDRVLNPRAQNEFDRAWDMAAGDLPALREELDTMQREMKEIRSKLRVLNTLLRGGLCRRGRLKFQSVGCRGLIVLKRS